MSESRITVPNALGAARLLGSPALVAAGAAGRETLFLVLFLGLASTDFLDGLLARTVAQETEFGSRLDTAADVVLYACAVAGLAWLVGDPFVDEWPWMAGAAASYALSVALSLALRGRAPVYHTWITRAAAVVAAAAVALFLLADAAWPIRAAAVVVALANLRSMGLTVREGG